MVTFSALQFLSESEKAENWENIRGWLREREAPRDMSYALMLWSSESVKTSLHEHVYFCVWLRWEVLGGGDVVGNCWFCVHGSVSVPGRNEKCPCWQQAGTWAGAHVALLCMVLIKIRMHGISGQKPGYCFRMVT